MSIYNGHRPICPCGTPFIPRFTAERYCSNTCVGKYGEDSGLPEAKKDRGKPGIREVRPVRDVPLAVVRSMRWQDETRGRQWD